MRYLLIGLGNIGKKRLAVLGNRCVGTVDPYNPKADFSDFRQCDPNRFDAAILAVPNTVKLELVRALLEMGKHVLVEKPLLLSDEAAARNFAALAEKSGTVCYTSYNHRFEPLIEEVKREIDAGTLGKIYCGRLFYGNGTVANVVGSWREEGLGVLEDLGPHLLDLVLFLFGGVRRDVRPVALRRFESRSFDHCILEIKDPYILLEMSFVCWKNNFEIELYGEKGSLHLTGLCKWGPSQLLVYDRVFPSGVPRGREKEVAGPDESWKKDLDYFETCVREGKSSFEHDGWISKTLKALAS